MNQNGYQDPATEWLRANGKEVTLESWAGVAHGVKPDELSEEQIADVPKPLRKELEKFLGTRKAKPAKSRSASLPSLQNLPVDPAETAASQQSGSTSAGKAN